MKFENIRKLWFRYKQFGGWRLVREYLRMGVAGVAVREIVRCAKQGQPFKTAYPRITAEIDRILEKRYEGLLKELVAKKWEEAAKADEERDTVWFYWQQGLENAPELVKACYNSQRKWLKDKKFVVVTGENYREYVSVPEHIEKKWREGLMPSAMFSDCVRLELLIKYGGTWIDSTVLCTGDWFDEKMMKSDLFVFQYYMKNAKGIAGISNWFISAKANNRILLILRKMLYQYWKDYDCVVEYFMFHRFFMLIGREMPEEVLAMPRGNSMPCLQMEKRSADDFDEEWYEKMVSVACFHKMNYRVSERARKNERSFYNEIVRRNRGV